MFFCFVTETSHVGAAAGRGAPAAHACPLPGNATATGGAILRE